MELKNMFANGNFFENFELHFRPKQQPKSTVPPIIIPEKKFIKKQTPKKRIERRGRKPKEKKIQFEEDLKRSFNVFNLPKENLDEIGLPNAPPEWFYVKKIVN